MKIKKKYVKKPKFVNYEKYTKKRQASFGWSKLIGLDLNQLSWKLINICNLFEDQRYCESENTIEKFTQNHFVTIFTDLDKYIICLE
jgi:hypothetical protein